jgi:hypothetical protein
MKQSLVIFMLVFCTLSVSAENLEPMADFGIHTIISSGPRTFKGKKLRAIVKYGEVMNPYLFIESIHVVEGYPPSSKVLWRKEIDVTGGAGNICEPSEYWSCSLENLEWKDSVLRYEIKASSGIYKCSADAGEGAEIKAKCSIN